MVEASTVDAVCLHESDNVCVAARRLPKGAHIEVAGRELELRQTVPMGHKVALCPIGKNERIRKYGQTIGVATETIACGQWVHTHNVTMGEDVKDYAFATEIPADPPPINDRTFEGIRRSNGKVGTRNYIAVISSVNCSASVSTYVAEKFDRASLAKYPNVDGVIALTHSTGCGMAYGSRHHEQLNRVLTGFAKHPNVAAYVLIGLGCEVGTMTRLVESGGLVQLGASNPQPPTLSIQACGGTAKTVERGVQIVAELLPKVNDVQRVTVPARELILGTECGGSDGNSGVTANPSVGAAADQLVAAEGTVILSETTEIYGAEHLLTRRARDQQTGERLVELIEWWKWYAGVFGAKIDNNPTPGNKDGGLTTIYEKSLGAVAKAGTTALNGVYKYAEPVTAKGLVVMDSPGFDPASITGMVASGANIVCFTTGRGSCYGCKPVPTIKVASNTPMYENLCDDMDLNAGVILEGTPVEVVGAQLFELILDVASGEKTKSECHGVGEQEFVPWQIGPVL